LTRTGRAKLGWRFANTLHTDRLANENRQHSAGGFLFLERIETPHYRRYQHEN
jgi:hypothetical protein